MTSKCRLGHLYREALTDAGLDASECSFQGPPLRQHGVNRILFYPGSFNPPHKGHLQLLRYSFENAGDDLHISGGILLPTDDERLRIKMRTKQYGYVLQKARRVQLLERSDLPGGLFWVFGLSEKDWQAFRAALTRVFAKVRLEVKLVMLAGPDGVKMEGAPDPLYWNCPDVITTDVSRAVNFRTSNGLVQISDYQGWGKVNFDINRLRSQMRGKLHGQPPENIEAAVQAAATRIRALWVCYRHRRPKGWLRFIPAELSRQPSEAPSSSGLRRLMATAANDMLETELEEWALSAGLLATFVRDARKRMERFEQTPAVETHPYDPTKVKW